MREIIVDSFAGGGGASTGMELAIGRSPDIAINHDPAAIAMHKANHPETEHYCEDVWDVDPVKATRGRPVGLAWFSPDCTHHSKARGGKPREKKIRALAWVVIRWAIAVKPRVIILENVEEFQDWGPLDEEGQPIPGEKGRIFESFVECLRQLGYEVEWRELVACDYGAPTSRKRLCMEMRRDGKPIVWPEPTHGAPDSLEVQAGKRKPWRTAAEIIDWSLPCPSIFDSADEIKQKYGLTVKRPLADSTQRRIAHGTVKFGLKNPKPFIVTVNHSGDGFRGQGIDQPLGTMTSKNGYGLVLPFLTKYHGEIKGQEARGQTLDNPLLTLDTSNRFGLVTANIIKFRGTNIGQSVNEPLQTITAGGNHHGLVYAFLVAYYGSSIGQDLNSPLHTIPTHDRFGLVIVHIKGEPYVVVDIGFRMLTPRELYAAQGFPSTYIIDGYRANGRPVQKDQQVAKCGNSVSPEMARAKVQASVPELCVGSGRVLSLERYKPAAGQMEFSL
ncbi:hypothetical protein A3844_01795 [Paenibacillus helianthi]|uniref:DNA (cytosine-5-)-methyltransferase n=1 Tax=Paenibacillus helianthi TaxID=1349432 RepID=A0ABX3EX92_9BACL|nr:DNA cytosine methyltransferase [Paenibacillus helianthi]OKP91871.1 hypothetical protein A3844_01795 [Paenibacillus helianthi]